MAWKLSRFRSGDLVEVRSREEILKTLDERACVDRLPFMPEMLKFCGKQFHVRAVAHKTCDTGRQTWLGRRLEETVHLEDLRCDGSAHGGCEAECTLFWRDAWLKPADQSNPSPTARTATGCTVDDLTRLTVNAVPFEDGAPKYVCQATEMWDASEALQAWDARQYIYDVTTGNHRVGRVLRVLLLAIVRWLLPRMPFGYEAFKSFRDWLHIKLTGRQTPALNAHLPAGVRTPGGPSTLRSGDTVQIKTQREIEQTVDARGRNRGLSFDYEEMAPYCGGTYTVRKIVTRIIDEPTGRMVEMKQPCVMLNGVVCRAEYAKCRLNCPRAIPSYWRELWLERV
jgi:hypothetical protein